MHRTLKKCKDLEIKNESTIAWNEAFMKESIKKPPLIPLSKGEIKERRMKEKKEINRHRTRYKR